VFAFCDACFAECAQCLAHLCLTLLPDVEAPQITCPADVVTTTAPGLAIGRAVWANPMGTDNSLATVTFMSGFNSGDYFPFPGPTVVAYNATDIYGNSASCFFTVTVTGAPTGFFFFFFFFFFLQMACAAWSSLLLF
jgi:hypothetical protein